MSLSLVQWDTSKNSYVRGGVAPTFRAGVSAVGAGVQSLAVTFSSALPDTSYAVVPSWMNTTGGGFTPQQQPLIVTAFTTTGFTVSWSAPTDASTYLINWIVIQQG